MEDKLISHEDIVRERHYEYAKKTWPHADHADWQAYSYLRAEGYSRYHASVMSGLADPDEAKER